MTRAVCYTQATTLYEAPLFASKYNQHTQDYLLTCRWFSGLSVLPLIVDGSNPKGPGWTIISSNRRSRVYSS